MQSSLYFIFIMKYVFPLWIENYRNIYRENNKDYMRRGEKDTVRFNEQ